MLKARPVFISIASCLVVGSGASSCSSGQADQDYARAASAALEKRDYSAAEILLSKAAEQAQRNNKLNESADILTQLGDVYASDEKWGDAEPAYRKALSLIDNFKAANSVDGANLQLRNLLVTAKLANVLRDQNKLDDAAALYRKVLDSDAIALTISDRSRIGVDYAQLLRRQDKASEANKVQTEMEATTSVTSVFNQGQDALNLGEYDRAETLFKMLLRSAEDQKNFADQTRAKCMLGICALRSGDFARTEKLNQEALALLSKIQNQKEKAKAKARSYAVLGFCLFQKGDKKESEHYLTEANAADTDDSRLALVDIVRLLSENQVASLSKTAAEFRNFAPAGLLNIIPAIAMDSAQQKLLSKATELAGQAHSYMDKAQYDQAARSMSQAAALFEEAHAESLYRSSTVEMCRCLNWGGHMKEARARTLSLLARCEKDPKPGFLDDVLMDMGTYERASGNHALSMKYFLRSVSIVEKEGAAKRPLLAKLCFYDLADGYRTAGKLADYEKVTRRALNLYVSLKDDNGKSLAMETLASCLENQNRLADAQKEWIELLAFRTKLYGARSIQTTAVLSRLGRVEGYQKKYSQAEHYYDLVLDNLESMNWESISAADSAQAVSFANEIVTFCKDRKLQDTPLSKRAAAIVARSASKTSH